MFASPVDRQYIYPSEFTVTEIELLCNVCVVPLLESQCTSITGKSWHIVPCFESPCTTTSCEIGRIVKVFVGIKIWENE